MAKQKGIEEKYQKLTDIEHVLLRPFMYIGSISPHTGDQYLFDGLTRNGNKISKTLDGEELKLWEQVKIPSTISKKSKLISN